MVRSSPRRRVQPGQEVDLRTAGDLRWPVRCGPGAAFYGIEFAGVRQRSGQFTGSRNSPAHPRIPVSCSAFPAYFTVGKAARRARGKCGCLAGDVTGRLSSRTAWRWAWSRTDETSGRGIRGGRIRGRQSGRMTGPSGGEPRNGEPAGGQPFRGGAFRRCRREHRAGGSDVVRSALAARAPAAARGPAAARARIWIPISDRGVRVMQDIGSMRARVEAAGELAGLLEAAWDGFGLLVSACRGCQERAGGLFAAFAFAAAAAAQGRLVLASAPSLAAGYRGETGSARSVDADLDEVADGLAGLAGLLAARLGAAAGLASDPGDRDACAQAAAEATRAGGLLARGR
jgi:hypothetical protein